jgi:hypothetical protein
MSATFVYQKALHVNERAVSGHRYLTRSNPHERRHQQLWYVTYMPIPMRNSAKVICWLCLSRHGVLQYLNESRLRKRWYQLLWYIINRYVPVRRYNSIDTLSLDLGFPDAHTIRLRLLKITCYSEMLLSQRCDACFFLSDSSQSLCVQSLR